MKSYIRQNPSIVGLEVVERFLLERINKHAQELSEIYSLVLKETEVNQKAMHEFLLKSARNINEVGNDGEEILRIESQVQH